MMKTPSSSIVLIALIAAAVLLHTTAAFQCAPISTIPATTSSYRYETAYSFEKKVSIRRKMAEQEDNYDLKSIKIGNRDFWTQQKELAEEMAQQESRNIKEEQMMKYNQRALGLVGDTAFAIFIIFPILWLLIDNPLFPLSYLLGSVFGLAYVYGLGKSVASLGGSVEDSNTLQGAGVGEARFAFLILLFVFVGKFRSYGLEPIPCIGGFFTYQLASLSQGLKEIND